MSYSCEDGSRLSLIGLNSASGQYSLQCHHNDTRYLGSLCSLSLGGRRARIFLPSSSASQVNTKYFVDIFNGFTPIKAEKQVELYELSRKIQIAKKASRLTSEVRYIASSCYRRPDFPRVSFRGFLAARSHA